MHADSNQMAALPKVKKVFGAAGDELVVEQLLIGEEYFG